MGSRTPPSNLAIQSQTVGPSEQWFLATNCSRVDLQEEQSVLPPLWTDQEPLSSWALLSFIDPRT